LAQIELKVTGDAVVSVDDGTVYHVWSKSLWGDYVLAGREGDVLRARRLRVLRNRFEINVGQVGLFELVSQLKDFELWSNGELIGSIQRLHPFTYRSRVEVPPDLPAILTAFMVAIVTLIWDRGARAGGG
jgi:hypothetical protein